LYGAVTALGAVPGRSHAGSHARRYPAPWMAYGAALRACVRVARGVGRWRLAVAWPLLGAWLAGWLAWLGLAWLGGWLAGFGFGFGLALLWLALPALPCPCMNLRGSAYRCVTGDMLTAGTRVGYAPLACGSY